MTAARASGKWSFWAACFWFFVLAALCVAPPANALPSYARQTGQACAMCHTALPELTPFGREFKLNGYVQGGGTDMQFLPPIAAMIQTSFNNTGSAQNPSPFPHVGPNNNLSLDQTSLFYGGAIWQDQGLGAFIQGTYNGVARQIHWDNTDIRWAAQDSLFDSDLTVGITLNNNPTVQDAWNTTPAWRYPFFSSFIAPTPSASAAALVDNNVSQQVLGLGAYGWWDHMVYAEFSGYYTLSNDTLRTLGIGTNPGNTIAGVAPYWRVAVQPTWGPHSLEVGTFGMYANINPQKISTNGQDNLTDVGFDTQYQFNGERDQIGVQASYIWQHRNNDASVPLGFAANQTDDLKLTRVKASYFYQHTYGVNVSYFNYSGTPDSIFYGSGNPGGSFSGSPNSDGWIFEANYLPFSNGGPDWWPWLNFRVGLQYTLYTRFNGGTQNFDGFGRNASANNTLFLYVLTAF
jgi:hypothetical protein